MNWEGKSVLNQTAQQGTTESGGPDAGDAKETQGIPGPLYPMGGLWT